MSNDYLGYTSPTSPNKKLASDKRTRGADDVHLEQIVLFDATSENGAAVDSSGRLSVSSSGTVADAAADSGNPQKVGGVYRSTPPTALTDGQRGDLQMGTRRAVWAQIMSADGTAGAVAAASSDSVARAFVGLLTTTRNHQYNETNYESQRGNTEGTLQISQSRSTSPPYASSAQTNYNARGVQVILSVTVVPGTAPALVLSIQGQDPISAAWYTLNAAPTAVTAVGTYVYALYPGIGAAAGGVTQTTSQVLPRTWRVSVGNVGANASTFSTAYELIL